MLHRIRKKPIASINVVPYIDVMLVLLVIFMVTAPLLQQGVSVDLPSADANLVENSRHEPVVLTVDVNGSYYLNIGSDEKQALDAAILMARVAAIIRMKPDVQVLVRGDHQVPYGEVVNAMVLLQQAGVPRVGLMTRPPNGRQ
jgi:biopolymer transport protein TolR